MKDWRRNLDQRILFSGQTHEEWVYTLEGCDPQWKAVLVLPSPISDVDIYQLALSLRYAPHSLHHLYPFVLDTETSLFGHPDEIYRGVSSLPPPVSVLAIGGAANWLSPVPSLHRVVIVDPVYDPAYDLAALPSYVDQRLKSVALRKVRKRLDRGRDVELAAAMVEASAASLLELATLQGLPPVLGLSVPHIVYKTAGSFSSRANTSVLEVCEPYRLLHPAPTREHLLARLLSQFISADIPPSS